MTGAYSSEALLHSDGAALAKLALLTQYGVPKKHRGPLWTEIIKAAKARAGFRDDEVILSSSPLKFTVSHDLRWVAHGRALGFAALRSVPFTDRLCRRRHTRAD